MSSTPTASSSRTSSSRERELDGIHVRRGQVEIRDCTIRSLPGAYTQGIDISFGFDLKPSLVERCTVVGGLEGIVTHFALVMIRDNHVSNTELRAITMTEMSMGSIEDNEVDGALGVGIFCGDYSHCEIEDNAVSDVRPDRASGDYMRQGVAIQAHYGAEAELDGNEVVRSPGGIAAYVDATIDHEERREPGAAAADRPHRASRLPRPALGRAAGGVDVGPARRGRARHPPPRRALRGVRQPGSAPRSTR